MKNWVIKSINSLSTLAVILTLTGCGASVPLMVRQPVVYSYNEPQSGKVDVILGVLGSSFADQAQISYRSLGYQSQSVREFISAFDKNFYDLMITKGINTLGPFNGYQDMTYPDKKNSDLLVEPVLNFVFSVQKIEAQSQWSAVGTTYQISIGGSLDLVIYEPLSQVKMWMKKINLKGDVKNITIILGKDNNNYGIGIDNVYSAMLVDFFNSSFPRISKYFNAEELAMLKKQSQELRAKKVY